MNFAALSALENAAMKPGIPPGSTGCEMSPRR
jgi:hypothetical protein